MEDDWDHYLCRLGEDQASIYLDLSIAAKAPVATHSHSVVVSVPMLRPREDGMSSEEEFEDLIALENHLIVRPHADEAMYVGRLTARGSRVFYFYTADPGSLARDVKAAMEEHPAYQYQINSHADPEWSAYLRFLYPSPGDHQRMKIRRLN
ncbi:DUF695 domain-containing protein [Methylobacterium iners]|uniref:DUF695 domain-containing protein n=1 Tax=Methylobacterium iners TaxID=418707 RepID=A0ABQ4S7H0_9HYPH|nr:DUF695 domain-containing protein [Methylobacterium iners]GJD97707.1 hypothetical protein OCOJLMKI_4940 [Methylobacterium iners]